jgi:hypothetical protein
VARSPRSTLQAHLSRALAAPPLNLHVLAVDWSPSQTSGAEYLDSLKAASTAVVEKMGSLTHRTSSLDADAIVSLMQSWPGSTVGDENTALEPAMLITLHGCGDLTVDALKALVLSEQRASPLSPSPRPLPHPPFPSPNRTAILCGCCYNLMTPALFPLSSLLSTNPVRLSLTRAHLRLTPQSPPTWHLTPSSTTSLRTSILKLAFRARFEAELDVYGLGSEGERRVGRIGECADYEEYRRRAMEKYGVSADELGRVPFGTGERDGEQEWEDAVWRLQVYWTLRSWLGPPLESLIVLDRFAFLVEGLKGEGAQSGERRVELVNLFEQATGSLRNLALVVR